MFYIDCEIQKENSWYFFKVQKGKSDTTFGIRDEQFTGHLLFAGEFLC